MSKKVTSKMIHDTLLEALRRRAINFPGSEQKVESDVKKCFVQFLDVDNVQDAMDKADDLAKRFPGIEVIGPSKAQKKPLRIIIHIPEKIADEISHLRGISMEWGSLDNCPTIGYWFEAYNETNPIIIVREYLEQHIADCEKCTKDKDRTIGYIRRLETEKENRKKS